MKNKKAKKHYRDNTGCLTGIYPLWDELIKAHQKPFSAPQGKSVSKRQTTRLKEVTK